MLDKFLDFLRHEKRFSDHTVKAYRTDLRELEEFLDTRFDEPSIESSNADQLRSWLVEHIEAGNSPRTVNRKLSSLRSYFRWRKKFYGLKKDPTLRLSAPKLGSKLPKFVDIDVLEAAWDVAKMNAGDDDAATICIIDTLYQTGMRSAELIGLKLGDVDFASKMIKVLGKRNKQRLIPLGASLERSMKNYLERRAVIDPAVEEKAFFVTDRGSALYPRYLYDLVNGYLDRIGAGSANGPHVLRHSFATHMLNRGADINSIKELLGHASLAATQVYTHTDIERLIEVHKKNHPRG